MSDQRGLAAAGNQSLLNEEEAVERRNIRDSEEKIVATFLSFYAKKQIY